MKKAFLLIILIFISLNILNCKDVKNHSTDYNYIDYRNNGDIYISNSKGKFWKKVNNEYISKLSRIIKIKTEGFKYISFGNGKEWIRINEKNKKNKIYETNNSNINLQLFPLPVKNKLNIHFFSKYNNAKIFIYNLQGLKIFEKNYNDLKQINIDLTDKPNGIYIIYSILDNQRYLLKKFIKN